MKPLHLCVTFLWITLTYCFQQCNFNFLPMPKLCNISQNRNPLPLNPCNLIYDIQGTILQPEPIQQVLSQYATTVHRCKDISPIVLFNQNNITATYINPYIVHININDSTVRSVFTIDQQYYTLNISKTDTNITAVTYVAFVRAIETFSQAFNCSRSRIETPCALTNLPIFVQDKPEYAFRGLMIDPARHFISLKLILQTVDTMMYSKLNVLHIHFTDEDSFPILLDKHPEIAEHAAFSKQEVYTIPDLKELVRYSMVRGVRVIPEIDTPGHSSVWAYAPQNKDVACINFPKSLFRGSLDVTLDATYDLVRDVLQQMVQVFVDPIIHLGGDELLLTCLKNMSHFENMTNEELLVMYRRKEKKILYELNPKKKPMFWVREELDNTYFPLEEDEIIHWWSYQQKPLPLIFPKNKYVMSYYGKHYLNMGTGNNKAVSYWNFSTWYEVYGVDIGQQHKEYPFPENILGAEMTLWGEVSTQYTHHLKIWVKNAAFAEKIWNPYVSNVIPGLMKRMIAFERLLNRRGIITSPITTRICEQNLHKCVDMT